MSEGIKARHARRCASKTGGRCNCTPTWQAEAYDRNAGKRIYRTFPTKSAAKHWRSDAYAALRAGELSADRGPTLREATDKWLAAMEAGHERNRSGDAYKPGAIRGYRDTLRLRVLPTLGERRVREITTRDVQRWVDALTEAGWAPATIDSALTPLRAFYRRALVRGEVMTNPTAGILKPAVRSKTRNVATPTEVAARLALLDADDRVLWATAFYAGLRRGELIGVLPDDVDLASGVIRVERGWDLISGEIPPKSRQGKRTVPIPAALRDHLDQHLLDADPTRRLFRSPSWVCKAAERAAKRWGAHGLAPITLHEARHSYASLMIAAGVNAKALSTFMGHANIGITLDLYGHLFPGSEIEAAGLLDSYLARGAGGSTAAQTAAHPEPVQVQSG